MLTLFTDRCFACEIIFSAVDIICTAISIVFYHRDSFHLLKILWLLLLAVQANLLYLPVLSIRADPKPYSFPVMILQTLKISSKKSWVLLKRTAKFPILILTPRWKNSGRNYGTFIIRGNLCLRQTHSQEHRMKIL